MQLRSQLIKSPCELGQFTQRRTAPLNGGNTEDVKAEGLMVAEEEGGGNGADLGLIEGQGSPELTQ